MEKGHLRSFKMGFWEFITNCKSTKYKKLKDLQSFSFCNILYFNGLQISFERAEIDLKLQEIVAYAEDSILLYDV